MSITKTVCFSGYRPEKFDFPLNSYSDEYTKLLGYINLSIIFSIEDGYDTFLCGMAQGFDILCGETVERLRRLEYPHLQLISIIPYMEHGQRWNEEWRERHNRLEAIADKVLYVNEEYHNNCFHERNRFMVDNSNRLVCFWNGKKGGTAYTVDYAQKQKIEIINLAHRHDFKAVKIVH